MSTLRTSGDHHNTLLADREPRVEAMTRAPMEPGGPARARERLVAVASEEARARREAERPGSDPAARACGQDGLVDALERDHQAALTLLDRLAMAEQAFDAALLGRALVTLFSLRAQKEEGVLMPALRAAGADVDELSDQMMVRMATDHN